MSLFNRIKEALGVGNEPHVKVLPPGPGAPWASSLTDRPTTTENATTAPAAPSTTSATATAAPASTTPRVDIAGKLDGMAAQHGETLNWRTSIVDLLKLLGIDSSLESRRELATELGCPADKMGDSAQMNMWLHRAVLKKLADHGGQVPPELLH